MFLKITLSILIGIILVLIILAIIFFAKLYKLIKVAGFRESWNEENGTIHRNIPYGYGERNTFDLLIPNDISKNQNHGLILFIHGGSWTGGKKEDIEYAARRYAKAGYLTATMNYSLLNKTSPEISFYTMLDEIQSCLEQIKKTSMEIGYQVDKVALSGASAGGHLASLYAYSHSEKSPIPISFIATQVGPSTFDADAWGGDMKLLEHRQAYASFISNCTAQPLTIEMVEDGTIDEIAGSISPTNYVDENSVPSLIAYGAVDTLVTSKHSQKLVSALRENNVPYTFLEYPHSGHELGKDPDYTKKYHEEFLRFAKEYFGY